MIRLALSAVFLLALLLPCNAWAEEISLEEVAVTGVDRSSIEDIDKVELVRLEKEKLILGERTAVGPPFSLGPFTLWARVELASRDTYHVSLFSGLTGETMVGDFQADLYRGSGRKNEELHQTAQTSSLFSWEISTRVEMRLSASFNIGNFDLLGPTGMDHESKRSDESYNFHYDINYDMGGKSRLTAGVFYEYTEIDRENESSERLYGMSLGFSTDRTVVSIRGWMYEFSEGDEDVYASASVREDEIIRSTDFTLGGVFGIDLLDGSKIILSPRVVAAWRPRDWFKLNAEIGLDNWLPSLSHEILLMPEFDPYLESPESVREKFVTISGQAVLSRMFEVSVSLDYRDASDMVYFTDSSDGYLDMMTMESCEFLTFKLEASFWLTDSLKLFGTHTLSYAYPGDGHEWYPYLPRSHTLLGARFDFLDDWTLSTELEIVGEVYVNSNSSGTLAPYEVLTVQLEYNIEHYLKVYARASNLANEGFNEYKGWRGYEKMFYFGLEITF